MERTSYIVVMAYCCMSGVTDKKHNQSPVQDKTSRISHRSAKELNRNIRYFLNTEADAINSHS